MNHVIKFKLALTGVIIAASLTSFAQQDKKAKKARKEVADAQKDLREAKTDSVEDFQKFKKEAEINIAENQKKITELKTKKSIDNKETKEKYDKKVLALEQKNNVLKNKIEKCDNTKTTKWTSFKQEFTHDMTELGRSIKDIGVNNEK